METILVLYASNNTNGNSAHLANWFLEGVNQKKYRIEKVHLYDLDIPYFTNENRNAELEQDPRNKDMHELGVKLTEAKHVIIAYPVWNFSIPAALKNVLDRASYLGRIWSEKEKKKVPGWKGKRFYLLFTQGAPWYGVGLDSIATIHTWLTLWYFGAKTRLVGFATGCGNGSKCIIEGRTKLKNKLRKKGAKYFG